MGDAVEVPVDVGGLGHAHEDVLLRVGRRHAHLHPAELVEEGHGGELGVADVEHGGRAHQGVGDGLVPVRGRGEEAPVLLGRGRAGEDQTAHERRQAQGGQQGAQDQQHPLPGSGAARSVLPVGRTGWAGGGVLVHGSS